MILCDREIQALMEDGAISINPRPPKSLWSSTAIDLRLDGVLLEWIPRAHPTGHPNHPRPMSSHFNVQDMMEDETIARRVKIHKHDGFALEPGSFILAFTQERIRLPTRTRIAARVEGKSSMARLGVGIHVTAPTIHAGFGARDSTSKGAPIQLEIFNLGKWTVILDTGMPICQLIFEEVRELPTIGYEGQFSAQRPFRIRRRSRR